MIIHGKEDKSLTGVWNSGIEHLVGLMLLLHTVSREIPSSLSRHTFIVLQFPLLVSKVANAVCVNAVEY